MIKVKAAPNKPIFGSTYL